jgi:hypothetical protein
MALDNRAFTKLELSKSLGNIKKRSTMEGEYYLWIIQTLNQMGRKKVGQLCSCYHIIDIIIQVMRHQINDYALMIVVFAIIDSI